MNKYERIFDENAITYTKDSDEFNRFFLSHMHAKLVMQIRFHKYETLNNACRMLGIKEFADGNELGWMIEEDNPFEVTYDGNFTINFLHLKRINLEEILGE